MFNPPSIIYFFLAVLIAVIIAVSSASYFAYRREKKSGTSMPEEESSNRGESMDNQSSKCPACGTTVESDCKECPGCGLVLFDVATPETKPEGGVPRCPYCKAEIERDVRKCRYCGEWIDKDIRERENELKSAAIETAHSAKAIYWMVAAVLIVIMLGGFAKDCANLSYLFGK